jgi:membrane protein YqaA with SNARE-associated domain
MFGAVIPFPVEITSSTLLLDGQDMTKIFLAMAIGSIIGGIISYTIGYDGKRIYNLLHKIQRKKQHEKSHALLHKYGCNCNYDPCWIPIMGDAVTVIAGVKKYDFKKFLISMIIGKTTHVIAIVYFSSLIFHYLG